ncbi:hypothetical protein GW17_00034895 [Ensete ventricosum]|nr:hypothetical protein GW17_00034895 [Ensete ventricosum]
MSVVGSFLSLALRTLGLELAAAMGGRIELISFICSHVKRRGEIWLTMLPMEENKRRHREGKHEQWPCRNIAQYQTENASSMRQRLGLATATNELVAGMTLPVGNFASKVTSPTEPKFSPISITQLAPAQPVTSIARSLISVEDDHKKAAAAVAAKLAASSSSAQVLTSILSSLAAEEAASMSNGLSYRVVSGSPNFPLEKRPRLENPMSMVDMDKTSYFSQVQQPQQQQQIVPLVLPQSSAASMQHFSQSNLAPPPPPLPPMPPPMQQYAHASAATMNVTPYGFFGGSLAPPPPLPSNASPGLTRPGIPPPPHQQPTTVGFYQSPGIGFCGQAQTAPSVQRQ